jgi:hypothetical protein
MATANFADLLKAAEDAGFSNCPPGTYDAKVVAGEAKSTSAGKDMIVVKFEIQGGPHGGRKVPNNFVISPENANALGFFFRHMRALGLDSAYFSQNPAPQKVAADLVGKTCRIEVGTRTWNGEEREDIKKIMPPLDNPAAPPVVVADKAPDTTPGTPIGAADPMAPNVPF